MSVLTPVENIDDLCVDKKAFDTFLYTPLEEAQEELKRRQGDAKLAAYVEQLLPEGVPPLLREGDGAVLFRHMATSTYEMKHFLELTKKLPGIRPLIFEYLADKFNDRNQWKHFAGKLRFFKGHSKDREVLFESLNLINFNSANNQPLTSLQTLWGASFVDLHHSLFNQAFPDFTGEVADLSAWVRAAGPEPHKYYKPFLALFLRNGILFENFLLDKREFSFTREVILKNFTEILAETGYKPLVVPLEPSDLEGNEFWLMHPYSEKALVEAQMHSA